MISHQEKDTLDAYFLWWSSYYDNSPSDTTIQANEYSYDAYKKLYEKEYAWDGYSNANFSLTETKNKKKILIGTVNYKGSFSNSSYTYIVVAYPYMITRNGKKEYHELTYSNGYRGGNTLAINTLKAFFSQIEPVGESPFKK
jgi:hypothetical protein